MKKILFLFGLLSATSLLAVQPSAYNCTIGDMSISFTMNSAVDSDGMTIMEPTIVMNGNSYSSDQISMDHTMMGTVYSIRMGYIPDLRSNYVSFLMPSVNVMPGRGEVSFRATMYNHYKRTSFGGTGMVHGVIDNIGTGTSMTCVAPGIEEVP